MTVQEVDDTVFARLQALDAVDHAALRSEWRRLYRVDPPKRVSRKLLVLGIGWKIQVRACGGFSAATKRWLGDLARTLERDGDVTRNRGRPPPARRPGWCANGAPRAIPSSYPRQRGRAPHQCLKPVRRHHAPGSEAGEDEKVGFPPLSVP